MNENIYIGAKPPGLPVQIGNVPSGSDRTMTSLEIAEVVSSRHDHVKRSIVRLADRGTIQLPPMGDVKNHQGQTVEVYSVPERDSYIVAAQLSPEFTAKLVDYWQAHRGQTARLMSPAEMFLHNAQAMVDIEHRQIDQGLAIADMGAAVARVEMAQTVLSSRPANAESITHIRKRIGKVFGLSEVSVNAVMHSVSYSPREAGMVRNDKEEALGNTYAVYWRKDVTNCFRQFAGECTQVTATMWTHPQIEGRFKMALPKSEVH